MKVRKCLNKIFVRCFYYEDMEINLFRFSLQRSYFFSLLTLVMYDMVLKFLTSPRLKIITKYVDKKTKSYDNELNKTQKQKTFED